MIALTLVSYLKLGIQSIFICIKDRLHQHYLLSEKEYSAIWDDVTVANDSCQSNLPAI